MRTQRRNAIAIQLDCCRREVRAKTPEELESRISRHDRNCHAARVETERARFRESTPAVTGGPEAVSDLPASAGPEANT